MHSIAAVTLVLRGGLSQLLCISAPSLQLKLAHLGSVGWTPHVLERALSMDMQTKKHTDTRTKDNIVRKRDQAPLPRSTTLRY
eukprot:5297910-Alexandrium_andersonii.AAC.1